jgi:hypothetical protein
MQDRRTSFPWRIASRQSGLIRWEFSFNKSSAYFLCIAQRTIIAVHSFL